MLELSRKLKLDILKALLTEKELFGSPDSDENIIKFLDDMLDLKALPSQDSRYNNAYDDAYKHLVSNYDWEYDYVLTERFNIVDDTEIFIDFLNRIIHPNIRNNKDDIMKYFLMINPYLEKEHLSLKAVQLDNNGLKIYRITTKEDAQSIPNDIIQNDIPFFVDESPLGFFENNDTFNNSNINQSFVLISNKGWNDFGIVSEFTMYFKSKQTSLIEIGRVKIIHITKTNTFEIIGNNFTQLNNNFCSLGQDLNYYINLKNLLGDNLKSVLWALQDTAFFSTIQENYEHNDNFKTSLIRYDDIERLMREAKYKIYGFNSNNLYSFKYTFKPKFAENELEIDFNFDNNSLIPNRIYAIIGKNGTGKTQLVSTLPLDISNKNDRCFTPKTPLFSKVIAVSYSSFDRFQIPKKTAEFNYIYCGLKDENGKRLEEEQLILRFQNSFEKIRTQNRIDIFLKTIENFIDTDLIREFINYQIEIGKYEVDYGKFISLINILSSGQSILILIITEIIANIRYDSLLIYDEPETHLHPNAISQLINTIYELSRIFQSYCIIATHSPIIVQELLSKNVYIIEKESNIVTARKPLIETFGENLTMITEEIFGNRDIPNQFEKILLRLAETGKSFDEILSIIETENIPLSINARVYLKSIINEKS